MNINCHTTHDSADKIISDLVDMRGAFVDKYRKRVFEKVRLPASFVPLAPEISLRASTVGGIHYVRSTD